MTNYPATLFPTDTAKTNRFVPVQTKGQNGPVIVQKPAASDSVCLMTVTPQLAQEWLETRKYDKQRNVRLWNVDFLAEEMRRGELESTTQIVFAVQNGVYYLVNGQHTLMAVVECQIPQTLTISERITRNDEETAHLYSVLDRNLSRTSRDSMGPYQVQENTGFSSTQVNRISAAVKIIHYKFEDPNGKNKIHDRDLRELIYEYTPAAREYFSIIAEGCSHVISNAAQRGPTLAIALVTFRYSAEKIGKDTVVNFWRGVILDDGIPNSDIRKNAHNHLMTVKLAKGPSGLSTQKASVSPAKSARYLAACFNAYARNRDAVRPKKVSDGEPISIIYSPFDGK